MSDTTDPGPAADTPLLSADSGPSAELDGFAERVSSIMLGAALGDAVATSAEHLTADTAGDITENITGAAAARVPSGLRITADTQLALYAMDGLLEAIEWTAQGEGADETACQWLAGLRWLRTQDVTWPQDAPSPLPRWLDQAELLHADHGEQGETLEALRTGRMGEVARPVLPLAEDRGPVLRSIPFGLLPVGWRSMAPLTIDAAAVTHGEAEAQSAATGTALILQAVVVAAGRGRARPVAEGARAGLEVLAQLTRPAQRTRRLLELALDAADAAGADDGGTDRSRPPAELGEGATASQTLALGVWAAVVAQDEAAARVASGGAGEAGEAGAGSGALRTAIRLARGAAGDRPRSPAPLAAALVAASGGMGALPQVWLQRLDAAELIEQACDRWIEGLGLSA